MANIKSLRIGTAVALHPYIEINKSMFGLIQKAVYTPTGSPVDAFKMQYTKEQGDALQRLLNASGADTAAHVGAMEKPTPAPVGNVELELCLARDHRFAAMRLYRYSGFQYRPETELRVYEGDDAEIVGQLF